MINPFKSGLIVSEDYFIDRQEEYEKITSNNGEQQSCYNDCTTPFWKRV